MFFNESLIQFHANSISWTILLGTSLSPYTESSNTCLHPQPVQPVILSYFCNVRLPFLPHNKQRTFPTYQPHETLQDWNSTMWVLIETSLLWKSSLTIIEETSFILWSIHCCLCWHVLCDQLSGVSEVKPKLQHYCSDINLTSNTATED